MDKISSQTENIATFKKSRSRRSVIEEKLHSEDSNSDQEYATSGFYVREKSNDKPIDCSSTLDNVSDKAEAEEKLKENGVTSAEASHSPIENGANAEIKDAEKKSNEQSENPEPDPNKEEDDNKNEANIVEKEIENENNVSSSSNDPEDSIATSTNVDKEEDGVSSTSNNVSHDTSKTKAKENKSGPEGGDTNENKNEALQKTGDESAKEKREKGEHSKGGTKDTEDKIEAIEETAKEGIKDDESKDTKLAEAATNKVTDNKKEPVIENDIKTLQLKSDTKDEPTKEPVIEKETKSIEVKSDTEESTKEPVKDKNEEPTKETNIKKKTEPLEAKNDNKGKPTKGPAVEKETEPIEVKSDTEEPTKELDKEKKKGNKKTKTATAKSVNKVADISEPGTSGLQKQKSDSAELNDVEMDEEDFDPSMFCPDITMDVDDAPVVPSVEAREAAGSPLPYEALFSTLVDEITGAELQIDLTPVEMEMRKQMFTEDNPVQKTKVHCTACNLHLGSALSGANNRFVHPLLKVLICKKCYHFYTSGEFQKDEDGSELYCRWCGQGGHVLCCSSCEYVFCKRCIRNNFGIKKFKEIRESDDWNCFRCEPDQLSILRAACAEFMDFYTRELARASALAESHPEVMTTDYTTCCLPPEPKKEEPKTPVNKMKRKRSDYEADPDYTPIIHDDDQPPFKIKKQSSSSPTGATIPVPSLRPIVPKPLIRPIAPAVSRAQIPTTGQVFRLAQPTNNARFPSPNYTVQKTATQGTNVRGPTFITVPSSKANSGFIQLVPTTTRPVQQRPVGTISTTTIAKPATSAAAAPVRGKCPQKDAQMKHEWFEKTVRAAARVNSNLSYTLTQLNRQQSQAGSVEALAMVHNKLQEVLSTSINSLIQIRKNLRTEFIAGIKNIKFPPKPIPTLAAKPIVVKDDDDVIFVNTTTSGHTKTQPPPLVMSKAVSLTKVTQSDNVPNPFSNPKPGTSGAKQVKPAKPASIANKIVTQPHVNKVAAVSSATPVKGGGFLKVRSFVSLQSVPSECITIPDDPTSPIAAIEDPLSIPEDPLQISNSDITTEPEKRRDLDDKQEISSNASTLSANSPVLVLDDPEPLVYIVTQKPPPEIKKMMRATVILRRSSEIEKLLMKRERNTMEEES